MTRELAIECIKTQRQFVDDMTKEAIDMAIEALKAPNAQDEPKQPENGSGLFGTTEKLDDRTTDGTDTNDGNNDLISKAAAQPEIIRCKDCKYNATSKKCLNPHSFFLVPADDDFCSYAERRTDG